MPQPCESYVCKCTINKEATIVEETKVLCAFVVYTCAYAYISMYMHVYVCDVPVSACICWYVHVCTCVCMCAYVCMYVCMGICVNEGTVLQTCVHIQAYLYLSVDVRVYVLLCVWVC